MTAFAYKSGKSFLHRMNAGIKLLFLLAISTAAFFDSAVIRAVLSAVLLLCAASAGIAPRSLLNGSKAVFILVVFIMLFRSAGLFPPAFSFQELRTSLFFGWSMIISFCAGSLLFSVTTMTELKEAASLGGRLPKTALALSLMLSFIPRFFEIWDEMKAAHRARGGRQGLPEITRLLPLAIERMIHAAGETASALQARGL
ncbi:hypothetical protein AGMMS50212_01900 [Spirochaetia bacterium]|nr:hypothetical protein AGMMS50212_01900 [Spirochaetia bacterium]